MDRELLRVIHLRTRLWPHIRIPHCNTVSEEFSITYRARQTSAKKTRITKIYNTAATATAAAVTDGAVISDNVDASDVVLYVAVRSPGAVTINGAIHLLLLLPRMLQLL